ncbi:MAG: ribosome silencing factor [Planctomycetota bacterium]|nr:ribosome silencing factor [Planctomycetota bacterium]
MTDTQASAGIRKDAGFTDFVYSVLDEKRAEDIVWLDVRGVTDIADDFMIATITSPRQGTAILDACETERKQRGLGRLGVEGEQGSSWMLLDYGDLVIHLFMPEQREYYALEHIWADAKRVK